jgi:H+-translocating NAD(P) transhydrogenase subunit alpha
MRIFIPRENNLQECRVAGSPAAVTKLVKLGYDVVIERGAGDRSSFPDEAFEKAGAGIAGDATSLWQSADIVLGVNPPDKRNVEMMKSGATFIGFIWPGRNPELVDAFKAKNISSLSMDCVPRISRAQKLDALSSMANIAGYRAVIEAAQQFGSFFTGQITAAGKVPPAKVMVIGAGVAGLSAIGAARGLGAIVRAFDTREAVRDQVKSMGAEFLELDFRESGEGTGGYAKEMSPEFIKAEMELFARQAKEVDIIITTALIPGKPAPKLITAEMVRSMKPGSVIVDLAAENGGNCELTVHGKIERVHGVSIIGYSDLPSRLPTQSSTLYANNLVNLITDMTPAKDGVLVVDMADQVIRGSLVTHEGAVKWPPPIEPSPVAATPKATPIPGESGVPIKLESRGTSTLIGAASGLLLIGLVGWYAPPDFVKHFSVFVLACFVGWQVVWNVTPALHTPLMSVTNAISGIIILGAMLLIGSGSVFTGILAFAAVLLAMINVAGGFWVTHRMLGMFRKQD